MGKWRCKKWSFQRKYGSEVASALFIIILHQIPCDGHIYLEDPPTATRERPVLSCSLPFLIIHFNDSIASSTAAGYGCSGAIYGYHDVFNIC